MRKYGSGIVRAQKNFFAFLELVFENLHTTDLSINSGEQSFEGLHISRPTKPAKGNLSGFYI